jgi:sialic acid synthase SpsE
MDTLRQKFNTEVGYSDHTEGIEISLAAVSLGATIIEKHYTLDKEMTGPDHKASISPEELKKLVSQIRNVEMAMLGDGTKAPQAGEIEIKKVVTKGLYWQTNLDAGVEIKHEYLISKRPTYGLSVLDYDQVIGKRLQRNVQVDTPLSWNDFE